MKGHFPFHRSGVPFFYLMPALIGLLLLGQQAAAQHAAREARGVTTRGISYLPPDDRSTTPYAREMCRLDLYRPEGVQGFPTVVFFHGGGLTSGQRSIPRVLTNRGWAVVGAGYRLHPQVRHPAYIEDAAAAVAWTFKNIRTHGAILTRSSLPASLPGGISPPWWAWIGSTWPGTTSTPTGSPASSR